MVEMRNTYKILVGKLVGKRSLSNQYVVWTIIFKRAKNRLKCGTDSSGSEWGPVGLLSTR
jgi:hypothetical protein